LLTKLGIRPSLSMVARQSGSDEPEPARVIFTKGSIMIDRRETLKCLALGAVSGLAILAGPMLPAEAANKVLKIGFVGVTSGPAAAWGTSNVRSMQTRAAWLNETGGVKIGDDTYDITIVTFDDQKDPKRAIAGMEKMAEEGIHYVVGPNVDDGAAAVRPVAESKGIMYFPYAFPKALYTAPASNAVLGMIANYQSGPAIYKYLKENKGVKSVAFVAANESDPLSQRDSGVAAAKALGLDVVADKDTYQNDTRDFTPVLTPIVKLKPDLLVLSGVAPGNAPLLIRAARELGYEGLMSAETAQDAKVLEEGAGELANGFISVGGASTPDIRSPAMDEFIARYTKMFGEYNDESNTKVYALEYILETLKANPKAIGNIDEFKKAMDSFSAPNPFVKEGHPLKYVGTTSFGQKRQVAVPMVVNEYKDGKFDTLFVGEVD
jgi:branched-chain amino acid transport system substrate-binding protein